MSTTLATFEDLSIEALTEAARESFEEVSWALEKTLNHASNFGRILSAVRKKIPHGQWAGWVQETFGDTVSLRRIQRYMQIANASDQTLLDGAKTIDEALARISEPKADRKPSVEVHPAKKQDRSTQDKSDSAGETATLAVSREETRRAPAHRPPERFTTVTPSYEDEPTEDVETEQSEAEEHRDLLDMFGDMKQLIREAMHEFPIDKRAAVWQQVVETLSKEDPKTW